MAHCQCPPASADVFIGIQKPSAPGKTPYLEFRSPLKAPRQRPVAVAARAPNCTESGATDPVQLVMPPWLSQGRWSRYSQ